MTPLAIPAGVLAEVYAHARAAFPHECCGYLRGPAGGTEVDEVIACTNAQAGGDNPVAPERGADTGFVIAGAELFAFARTFDSARPARIVYHSHPNGRAYFSAVDREAATGSGYPVQHLVVGVTAAGVTEAVQLAWSEAAHEFVEIARWNAKVRR